MTPTDRDAERAREIASNIGLGNFDKKAFIKLVNQALAAVRAEEREECAKVAEGYVLPTAAALIARAIREKTP